jgi:5-methylcytosine-specific restriction endonuclease McrA
MRRWRTLHRRRRRKHIVTISPAPAAEKLTGVEKTRRKIEALGGFCACCGENFYPVLTLDHIVPKARGGKGDSNLQVLCASCNHAKGVRRACPHQQIVRELIWQNIVPREAESAA